LLNRFNIWCLVLTLSLNSTSLYLTISMASDVMIGIKVVDYTTESTEVEENEDSFTCQDATKLLNLYLKLFLLPVAVRTSCSIEHMLTL